jgi:hypothetical protein
MISDAKTDGHMYMQENFTLSNLTKFSLQQKNGQLTLTHLQRPPISKVACHPFEMVVDYQSW